MKPNWFFRTRTIVGASMVFSILLILFGFLNGDISEPFDEGRPGTFASVLLLLLISITSFKIYRRRPQSRSNRLSEQRLIWLVIAVGFFFLALDDAGKIHEGIDKFIHEYFDMVETDWSDRIDDIIIAIYALIGAATLYLYRAELNRYRFASGYLLAGFSALLLTIVLDLMSNGPGFFLWLGATDEAAQSLETVVDACEEVSKLLAEAIFLSGFVQVLHAVSNENKTH